MGVGQLPSEPSSVAVDNRMDLRGGGPPSPLVVASAVADQTGVFTIYKILLILWLYSLIMIRIFDWRAKYKQILYCSLESVSQKM